MNTLKHAEFKVFLWVSVCVCVCMQIFVCVHEDLDAPGNGHAYLYVCVLLIGCGETPLGGLAPCLAVSLRYAAQWVLLASSGPRGRLDGDG